MMKNETNININRDSIEVAFTCIVVDLIHIQHMQQFGHIKIQRYSDDVLHLNFE